MRPMLIVLLVLSFSACDKGPFSKDFNTGEKFLYEARTFSLHFPDKNWELVNLQGTDSYVGYFGKGKDKIYFDYGWYGGTIDKNKTPKPLSYEETTINGKKAIIAKESTQEGILLTAIIKRGGIDDPTSNRLHIYNPGNENEIVRIFRTHQFK